MVTLPQEISSDSFGASQVREGHLYIVNVLEVCGETLIGLRLTNLISIEVG